MSTESPGSSDFCRICPGWNEDRRWDAEAGRRVGHALGVVTSAGGDHATRTHLGVREGDPGEGAAQLERGGALFVLAFEPHRHAGQAGQVRAAHDPGALGHSGEHSRGPVDVDASDVDVGGVDVGIGDLRGWLVGTAAAWGRAGS